MAVISCSKKKLRKTSQSSYRLFVDVRFTYKSTCISTLYSHEPIRKPYKSHVRVVKINVREVTRELLAFTSLQIFAASLVKFINYNELFS